jgi:hypothetical protein
MARFMEPTDKQERGWAKWVHEQPPKVRAIAKRFDPWTLYRLKTTNQRVILLSISENNTITVAVTGQFNLVTHERQVFGINPDDLEPCDLPAEDEMVGSAMTDDEVEENIDVLRVMVRPDLWYLNAEGKAVRKQ